MDLTRLGIPGAPSVEIRDLAYDTRSVTPGALFFCIKGSQRRRARPRGCRRRRPARPRSSSSDRVDVAVPQLLVPSVRAAMGPVAARFFGDPSSELEVAAVTGTNGKTTTAFLLHSILECRRPAARRC